MQVREIMSKNLICCNPESPLTDVARMMADHNCGEIPVVEPGAMGKPVGVITDRDITCRTVAKGRNPLELTAKDCMSSPVITVRTDTNLEDCCRTMEQHQVRRVPVVDESGACRGVVSQADIALVASEKLSGKMLKEVSRPSSAPSRIG